MKKFVIEKRQHDCYNRQFSLAKENGWSDAYIDVPGKQAYEEGLCTGLFNGYADAVHDIKKYIKELISVDPDINANKILELIVYFEKKYK